MDAILPIAMCLCGGLGASARYVCDSYIKAIWHNAFPLSTFIINVIAGLLAGIVAALSMESAIPGACYGLPWWLLHILDYDERSRRPVAQG